jgi:DNA-binding transcriptional LysR family regulator
MDLEALRVVLKVAELGSFTLAATHLGISRSRASQQVQELEGVLGVPLFRRTTRVVTLTADGEQFVERSQRLLSEADELAALFQGPRNLRGRVRLDLPVGVARNIVLPRLPEFVSLHPMLELEISATDRRVDVLRDGFDFVLRVGALGDSALTALRLGVFPMVNCISPAYLRRYGVPTFDDLDQHWIVHYSQTLGTEPPTFDYLEAGAVIARPMRRLVTVNNADAYQAACMAGLGIVQVPR